MLALVNRLFPFLLVVVFNSLLQASSLCCALLVFLSSGDRVPGRQRQRNAYVTTLRCPGIYLIISLKEVGEAPNPPGLQTPLA